MINTCSKIFHTVFATVIMNSVVNFELDNDDMESLNPLFGYTILRIIILNVLQNLMLYENFLLNVNMR